MFSLNKIIWALANPFVAVFLLLLCAIVFRRRFWMLLSLVWLWFWSSMLPLFWFDRMVISKYPPMRAEDYPTADAIVILGGGMGSPIGATGYAEINPAADRAWMAARLWAAGNAPIVIPTGNGCCETDAQLLMALGVPDRAIVVENQARNTEENAKCVARKLSQLPNLQNSKTVKPSVLLVTSVWHMDRSLLMFAKYAPDVRVVPVATDYEGRTMRYFSWDSFVPKADILAQNMVVIHEIVGYVWYRFVR